jgi:hypothetical protein
VTRPVVLFLLCACDSAGENCRAGDDAGTELRQRGEPCLDGVACAAGLTCTSVNTTIYAGQECLAAIGGEPRCDTDADCGGHFARTCLSGVCRVYICNDEPSCPVGHCALLPRCVTYDGLEGITTGGVCVR